VRKPAPYCRVALWVADRRAAVLFAAGSR